MIKIDSNEYLEIKKRQRKSVIKVGFWTAILTAVLAAAFFIMGCFGSTSWDYNPDIINYIWSYIKIIDYALFIPGFLLAPVFVVLMACIHYYASHDKRIFSLIGLGFALIYATLITADYFILWTVTLPSIVLGETGGLSLLSMYNPHGIFVALESLAYLMMSLALLCMAPVFQKGKSERALRWIFIAGFVLAIGSLFGVLLMSYDIVMFEIAIITIYCPVLIISGILLSKMFKRVGNSN